MAVAHRQNRDSRLVIKGLDIDAYPVAQALAAFVVPRHAAGVHLGARRLADDKNSCRGAGLLDRARAERQMPFAGAACAHGGQQVFKRLMDVGGQSLDEVDRMRFHKRRLATVVTSLPYVNGKDFARGCGHCLPWSR